MNQNSPHPNPPPDLPEEGTDVGECRALGILILYDVEMHILICARRVTVLVLAVVAGCGEAVRNVPATQALSPGVQAKLTPVDVSTIRGVNYRAAAAADTTDYWRHYDPKETERDLGYADRLAVNQVRVFVNYAGWKADEGAFANNLVDLVRACYRHKIGVMITVGNSETMINDDGERTINFDKARELVAELVSDVGEEPGLAFWDASNEPDFNAAGTPGDREGKRMEIARFIAGEFHRLDQRTPVTIGAAFERNMEKLADVEDVLSFHDYLQTRGEIAADIARAKLFAAGVGKQVMDTEMGCVARANPYDVTLEEHMRARVGWYMWELMITKRWGNVHGVFYPDGTVRDPSIAAAMLGFFRNRGDDVVLENPDRENWVTRAIGNARRWSDSQDGTWEEGLNDAETMANLLEAGQLVAMREPPTREVELMRKGAVDMAGLRELVGKYVLVLEPYQKGR